MATTTTETIKVTVDAPFPAVVADLADPGTHPEWATDFFAGPAKPGDEPGVFEVEVPLMGGPARMRVEAEATLGVIDLFLSPRGVPFGAPLPIRVLRNGDGVDVLFTLAQPPGLPDEAWQGGLASMRRELERFRARHERATR